MIPKSRKEPERIIQAINRPARDTAQIVAFSWLDTREIRAPDSRAYAILNDSEKDVPPAVVDALQNYEVKPVLWSRRGAVLAELVA